MKKVKIKIRGRPGWHIECSVMSQKFLNTDTLDIHSGGRDLIFPHHENEIAQSEALTGKPFAKYWIHHGLLTINGQKMAKSLGNFVTIKDFIAKYKNANLLKMFFLSAHYSHPIDYNEEKIEEAKKQIEKISIFFNNAFNKLMHYRTTKAEKHFEEIEDIRRKFLEAMDDDFNMPQALARMFDLINIANKNMEDLDFIYSAKETLNEFRNLFNINIAISITFEEKISLEEQFTIEVIDHEVKKKILEREKARQEKNFALSDKIRKELEEKGIILEDTKDGTTWRRKL